MAYQTSDIVTLVQKRVRDPAYDRDEIKQYLNDCINDIFNEYRLPFMEATQLYVTIANNSDITAGTGLPTNYSQAIDLRYSDSKILIPYGDLSELGTLNGLHWFLYSLTPTLSPTPTVSYTVSFRYYKQPSLLVADSDVPPIPSAFQELLVLGASYRVLEIKDNYDQAAILEKRYTKQVLQLVGKSAPKQVGQATQIPSNRYTSSKRHF